MTFISLRAGGYLGSGGGGTVPSIAIDVYSDAGLTTPVSSGNYGSTVYVKLTATGITPTSYIISFKGNTGKVVTTASSPYTWVIDVLGSVTIYAEGTDGSSAVADATPFSFTTNVAITKSIAFDGVNDTATGKLLRDGSYQDFSLSMWVKLQNTGVNNAIFSAYQYIQAMGSFALTYIASDTTIRVASWTAEWVTASFSITPDSNFHLLTATYDYGAQQLKLYWDDALKLTISSFGIAAFMDTFTLAYQGNFPFIGADYGYINLTDIRCHSSVLALATVQSLHSSTSNLSGTEVQRWAIQEASGTTSGLIDDIIGGQKVYLRNMSSPYGIVVDAP